jgi:hypothetical protein
VVRLSPWLRPYFRPLKRAYTAGTRAVAPATVRLSRLRGGHLPEGVAWTMEDAAADGGRFTLARPEEVLHRTHPDGHPHPQTAFTEALEEVVPRVGVLELAGGRVLQPHGVVVTGEGRLLQEQCWYFGTTRPREHPVFLQPFPPAPQDVPGRLGVLTTRGDSNYYHFLHDCLPRTAVLEQAEGVAPVDRWYVPRATRFQRELLELWGIPEDQVVDAATVPHVRAGTLVVPGVPSLVERNPPWVAQLLRERLRPPGLARVPGRHLYLTRGTQKANRVATNEAEVLALLRPLGFEPLDAGDLSVAEQIRTFAEADVLVALHGAALANLVFCSPGASLIELFPSGSLVADYWKMASGVPGLEYRYLCGTGPAVDATRSGHVPPFGPPVGRERGDFVVADITVDLPRLEAMVHDALAAREQAPPG